MKLVDKSISPDATYTVAVVKNGDPFGSFKAKGPAPVVDFDDTPAASGRTYYRVEVKGTPTPIPMCRE